MNFSVRAINNNCNLKKEIKSTVSFSVDCDALEHYLNFAPENTVIQDDPFTYQVMCRHLLELFDLYNIKATFYCIANQLRDANTLRFFKEVVNQGHQIGNHTYDHPDAHQLTDQQYADNILRGHHTIVELLGCEPKGFRAPAYYITESSLLTLARLGYFYDSSATFSPLTRGLIRLLEILKKNFKAKTDSKLHKKFSGHGPYCKVVGFV